jgi:hypothetical protein
MILLRLLSGLLLAFLLAPAAQDGDLSITALAGFDGLYKSAAPVPVIITARNDGPPLDGELRVITGGSAGAGALVYSAPVSLPTGSDKRIPLVVHLPAFQGPLVVQLVSGEEVIGEVTANRLSLAGADTLLYGVVTPDPGGLAFLETIPGGRGDAAVAFLDLSDLPDVSSAWNALDVLVLDDTDTSRLTAGQSASLRAWIESGGQFVVTGGPGGPTTAAGVADLLPVTITGTESVADLPALSAFAGEPFAAPGPYVVTRGELVDGESLIDQDGLPLLAYRPFGRGGVTFLALDPNLAPLAGWPGNDALWSAIAGAAGALPPWAGGVNDNYAAAQAVSYIPGLRLPSIGQLFLFLAAYTVIIGPVNFLVLRRLKRRELAWITIPALVLLFSAITFLTGFRTRGATPTLNVMSVAFGSVEAERLRTQSVVGLYSPRRGQYDVILPYDSTAFPIDQSFSQGVAAGNLDAIVRAADLMLRGVRTDTSEVAAFIVESHRPRPPISATAELAAEDNRVAVTVRNDAAQTLENGVIIYGEKVTGLGDLAPGQERTVQLSLPGATTTAIPTPDPMFPVGVAIPNPLVNDPSLLLGTGDFFNDPVAFPRWQLIQSTYDYEQTTPAALPDPTQIVTLAGWLAGGAEPVALNGVPADQAGATLLLLEIPVQ